MIAPKRSAARAGVPPPKYRLVTVFFADILITDKMDLPQQSINIPVTQFFGISDLAIRAETTDISAEWKMYIQSQVLTVREWKILVIVVFKNKWFS